jgi:pyruvate formate lyase activating enzyme
MDRLNKNMEACHYSLLDDGRARCALCPQSCVIPDGKTGICRTRKNEGGKLLLLNYGRYTSIALDPIEKKPLYHFYPGGKVLSIGGLGCNLCCEFCQNWTISQGEAPTRGMTPRRLAEEAASVSGNIGVAFTYNEPLIWFEFIRDCASPLREENLKIVLVTNGFINPGPFAELAHCIDAMNIDLKSSDDDFYKKNCGGRVGPVMETIVSAHAAGIWVEVTQLLIPGLNDGEEQLRRTASWLASVSPDIPLHLSRYFPNYKMELPPTETGKMRAAYEAAKEYLKYVYLGNVGAPEYGRTVCAGCGAVVISRAGYDVTLSGLAKGMKCKKCGASIAGVDGASLK